MEIKKYKSQDVLYHIRHNLRTLPSGHSYGNEAIVKELTKNNYSLLSRGNAEETNTYRKNFEKKIHIYKRKDLVHAIELVIQVPADCPAEQHEAFFNTALEWFQNDYLKVPEAILSAEVHRDERFYSPEGEMISKDHMHVLAVPVVEDTKHEGVQYKLCADQLTKDKVMHGIHADLQRKLDAAGIQATIFKRKSTDGKTIRLSVKQLKEITTKTGIKLDHTMTIEELSKILVASKELEHLRAELLKKEKTIEFTNTKMEILQEQNESIQHAYEEEKEKLKAAQDKLIEMEAKALTREQSREHTWGDTTWGSTEITNDKEEEHTW